MSLSHLLKKTCLRVRKNLTCKLAQLASQSRAPIGQLKNTRPPAVDWWMWRFCGGITQRSWLLSVSPEFAALVKEWTAAHRRDGSPPRPHRPDSMLAPFPDRPTQNPLQLLLPFNLSLTAVSTKWNTAVKSAVLRSPPPAPPLVPHRSLIIYPVFYTNSSRFCSCIDMKHSCN